MVDTFKTVEDNANWNEIWAISIDNMKDKSGYFYFRKLRWKKVKIPMLHWGQATMYKALTHLLSKIY